MIKHYLKYFIDTNRKSKTDFSELQLAKKYNN